MATAILLLVAKDVTAQPLTVQNPFVRAEVIDKIQGIQPEGQPVVVLNPYVEQLASAESCPYRRIVPSPQMIFPTRQQ